jgi:hypothetical protein
VAYASPITGNCFTASFFLQYAYLTYIIINLSSTNLQLSGIRLSYHRFGPALSARAPSRYFIWLAGHYIAMSEPLESELAGVTLESDALPQEDFPPGDL